MSRYLTVEGTLMLSNDTLHNVMLAEYDIQTVAHVDCNFTVVA